MWLGRRWLAAGGMTGADPALRMTLLALVLRPAGPPPLRVASLALAGLALVSPPVSHTPGAWLGLATLNGLRVVADWPLADNHVYLAAYWCLAVALAFRSPRGPEALAASGRTLLGLAFALAVLWKGFLSPDYRDGRFFRVTLLTDERFASVAMLLGGLSAEELQAGRDYLRPLPGDVTLVDAAELPEPPAFVRLAATTTWGTLILEAVVAGAFLAPLPASRRGIRHGALLAFCVTTYALAPVAGFGWLLLAMGLAQCRPEDRIWRGLYLGSAGLVLLCAEIAWARVLLDAVRGS